MATPRRVEPTLVDALRKLSGDERRGFTFLRGDGTERFCSFAEMCRLAEARGAHFAARGLKKGDRLAMVVPDPDEFVLSFVGAMFAGIVPVPMYPQLSFKNVEGYHETVAHITQAAGASLLLTTSATRPFVEPVLGRVDGLRSLMTTDELAEPAPRLPDVPIGGADLAFLQFTSGSTSRPKGVVVTHDNLAANAEAFMFDGIQRSRETDVGVSWLPLFHDMGLIGFVVGPLFSDIPVVFIPTATFVRSPRVWLEQMHKHRATITYAPNFAYALVAKRVKDRDVGGLDLSTVRVAGCGAEPISAKTLRDFATRLAPAGFDPRAFLPSYGMAEATLAITFSPHGQGLRSDYVDAAALRDKKAEPSSFEAGGQEIVDCGVAFPGHEIAVVDDSGARLGDRQVGEIITRGPSVTQGYFREPELTAQSFRDGWLHTGDLGYVVEGRVFICGRLKDIVIIRGRNYYPNDIEWAVGELQGVRRGNVVAFGVDVDGEEHLAVAAEGHMSEAEALRAAIAQVVTAQFALTVDASRVVVVPQGTLPRTSSGKPQRRKTKQMFLEGLLSAPKNVLEAPAPGI